MPGHDPDDEGTRPPPHPLDRPWIHPSELGGRVGARPPDTRPPARRRGRDLVVGLVAGTLGAVATVTVLGLVGALDRSPGDARAASTTRPTDAAGIAAGLGPTIAAVMATSGTSGEEHRGSAVTVSPHELLTTTDVVPDSVGDHDVWIASETGTRHPAEVQGRDPMSGLVLLHVPAWRGDPARWSDGTGPRAGDWVVGVGRLATGDPWVTSGVVTAVGTWMTDTTGARHAGVITASADLADDARGGALVDRRGHVLGVLTATDSTPARMSVVPGVLADGVATQLAARGWVSHGALGVRVGESGGGATVTEVLPGGCGAKAGLRTGDLITAVDGTRTPDTSSLVYEIRRRERGTAVILTVRRGDRTLRVNGRLDEADATDGADPVDLRP